MKTLALTPLIKTFVRPQCLDNLLHSLQEYQNVWGIQFADILIIDDSDDEHKALNNSVVDKYSCLNISLKQYEFNSLGLSKGRNEGLKSITTEYFLLCDDDFVFDLDCDLEHVLCMAQENNLDILSGHYRNIKYLESKSYKRANWLGFIIENDEFDICNIYENTFPEFMYCDIAQNFFIGNTARVKEVGFPDDLPLNEHNIFFLRCKQQGLSVASTSKLYTKHLHLRNENFDYDKYRMRNVEYKNKKRVLGTLTTETGIYKFNDYINVSGEKFYSPLWVKKVFRERIKKWVKSKYFAPLAYFFGKVKLKKYEAEYPQVLSTSATLDKIILEKKSVARIGDGELKLIQGIGLGEKGARTEYQVFDAILAKKLQHMIENPIDECLLCIIPFRLGHDDIQNYEKGLSYWENFWLSSWPSAKRYYDTSYVYGNACISRIDCFKENSLQKIKSIWQGRKTLFVVGEDSHWVDEPRLFGNVQRAQHIVVNGRSSFSSYDQIFAAIKEYDTSWLVLLAIGPTSKVLAYELSQQGYQALDIGHMPNCYLQSIGERNSPEIEHFNNKQYKRNKSL